MATKYRIVPHNKTDLSQWQVESLKASWFFRDWEYERGYFDTIEEAKAYIEGRILVDNTAPIYYP